MSSNRETPSALSRLLNEHAELHLHVLDKQIASLCNENAGFRVKRQKFIRLVEEVGMKLKPYQACRDGCDACCHLPTMIYEHEAKVMAEISGRPMQKVDFRPKIEALLSANNFVGRPCPFLVEHNCSIYEQRPLICRLHHSLADSPEYCRPDGSGRENVPMLDPDFAEVPYTALVARYFPREPWGVIQEFFPENRDQTS